MLSTGERIGSFEIGEPIGAGGMGVLFRARDTRLGRDVAIKVLSDSLLTHPEHMHRFVHEARAASALNHPNIVTIHEIGEHNGIPYIAMELIEGRSLRHVMNDRSISTRRLVGLLAQVARGLAAAHAKGIVHRDLKPENIMITRDGFAKILDFGLAKSTAPFPVNSEDPTDAIPFATTPGVVMGTVSYMSPEQARGLPIDSRSDQFSFGSILYEALAGVRPFRGETPIDVISAITAPKPAGHRRQGVSPETTRNEVVELLRVNRLKLDQSFVRDIVTDSDDGAIATAVLAMGHSLSLEVIAEGVEKEDQLAFLRERGCRRFQGFLFSAPLPPEDLSAFIRRAQRASVRQN